MPATRIVPPAALLPSPQHAAFLSCDWRIHFFAAAPVQHSAAPLDPLASHLRSGRRATARFGCFAENDRLARAGVAGVVPGISTRTERIRINACFPAAHQRRSDVTLHHPQTRKPYVPGYASDLGVFTIRRYAHTGRALTAVAPEPTSAAAHRYSLSLNTHGFLRVVTHAKTL